MKRLPGFLLGALVVVALVLLAYRALPPRPFAADDFQWLLGARSLNFNDMLRGAFSPDQNHFYRPLIWLLFWLQARVFALDPRGYHAVSLVLHTANALLLGWLVMRLRRAAFWQNVALHSSVAASSPFMLAFAAVAALAYAALQPALFEAVVWVSAQSELLAAFWLLLMLHAWFSPQEAANDRAVVFLVGRYVLAVVFFAFALLTKESAIIGLPLLLLLDLAITAPHRRTILGPAVLRSLSILRYLAPTLLTCGYLLIQLRVERENYVVGQGGYGFGPQLLLNPLRSLGLLVAPFPGTEHANAWWLPLVGAVLALGLVAWACTNKPRGNWQRFVPLAALTLTLLPTAPFASPPDSRYMYLPVFAGAMLLACILSSTSPQQAAQPIQHIRRYAGVGALALLAMLAVAELAGREQRFAMATGADGSLMQISAAACAAYPIDRIIVLNAPLAEPHARAVLDLACGNTITPIFVDTMAVAEANLEPDSLIIDFPQGTARIAQQTYAP